MTRNMTPLWETRSLNPVEFENTFVGLFENKSVAIWYCFLLSKNLFV